MKLNGTVTVQATQEEVWKLFMDPTQLVKVVPGCEQVHQLDETHYEAVMAVKVQFMTIRAKAQGALLETEPMHHLVAEMVGEPMAMAGAFRTRLVIDLEPIDAATTLHYVIDLTMLGRLASLGEALVRSTAQRLSTQFSDNVSNLFSTS